MFNFVYNKEKDVWCLLNKGKSSLNSQKPTKTYELLVSKFGENPTEENAFDFIEKYIDENKIDVRRSIENFQKDWGRVESRFQERAEKVFGVSLPNVITAYLTVNSRCPYNIDENYFFMYLEVDSPRHIAMHELWHFYTWYAFGASFKQKLGASKYNDLKESLTVLLNAECSDLLPDGVIDIGYPQHKELRRKILEFWEKDKDIARLWQSLI